MSEEANRRCMEYNKTARSLVTVDGKFLATASINLCKSVIFNLTRTPQK
jgi:hypothetical protein